MRYFFLLTLLISGSVCVIAQTDPLTDPRDGSTYKTTTINDGLVIMAEDFHFKPDSGTYTVKELNGQEIVLYDWNTAKALAPEGWRLPKQSEFEAFIAANGRKDLYTRVLDGTLSFSATGNTGIVYNGDSWSQDGIYYWTGDARGNDAIGFALKQPPEGKEDIYNSTGQLMKSHQQSVRYVKSFALYQDPKSNKTYRVITVGDHALMVDNYALKTESGSVVPGEGKADPEKYGYQYTWEQAKALAPEGWHLPSKEEFEAVFAATGLDSKPQWEVLQNHPVDFSMAGWTNPYELSIGIDDNVMFWTSTLHKKDKYYGANVSKSYAASFSKKKAASFMSVIYFKD